MGFPSIMIISFMRFFVNENEGKRFLYQQKQNPPPISERRAVCVVFVFLSSHGMVARIILRAADEVAVLIHAVAMAQALLVVPEVAVPAG